MKTKLLPLLLSLCLLFVSPVYGEAKAAPAALGGITAAGDGGLLACDAWNKVIWRIDGNDVSIFAGTVPVEGLNGEPQGLYHDGKAQAAYFMEPWDITPFLNGYAVSDARADNLRYIENGIVYTLAGTGKAGGTNGMDRSSAFNRPTGLATDSKGTLYVADTGNGQIRCVSKSGQVSTFISGLTEPTGICWHGGALYVAETGRSRILRIRNGEVEVLAGISRPAEDEGEYYGGFVDGPVAAAEFDHPRGVAVDADGTVYVADTLNQAVRMIRDGRVYTMARNSGGTTAPLSPVGLTVKRDALYVTDAFLGTVLTLSLAEKTYADVPAGAWYAADVSEATRRGLVSGTGGGAFSPAESVTRAMFVTMLSRLHLGLHGAALIRGSESFSDVADGQWFTQPVQWAASIGTVSGTGGGLFCPQQSVTRQEIASMLFRYASDRNYNITEESDLSGFEDADSISDWAQAPMRWLCGTGIMKGNDRKLCPADPASRAEVVALLIRFMDYYQM